RPTQQLRNPGWTLPRGAAGAVSRGSAEAARPADRGDEPPASRYGLHGAEPRQHLGGRSEEPRRRAADLDRRGGDAMNSLFTVLRVHLYGLWQQVRERGAAQG